MNNLVTHFVGRSIARLIDEQLNRLANLHPHRQAVLLQAENLHKIYDKQGTEVRAVNGVSITVRRGEILVIAGPSGAGKSTLLHLLGGLDKPTRGTVRIDGIDIYNIPDDKLAQIRNKKIGFVFQFYHLLPEFSILENVMLPALIKKRSLRVRKEAKEKAAGLLEAVGLIYRMNHKPGELSGGEAQRVAIARALINDPYIVFCDEPTGNLDSKTSGEINNLICTLNREKYISFVIVTHGLSLAERAAKILHIRDGKLE